MAKIVDLKKGLGDIEEGSFLVLVSPEKIPHLIYLQDERYYSLTYKGVELAFSFLPYLERLLRTNKKMIFLELNTKGNEPFNVFSQFEEAGYESTTCLDPIKSILLPESKARMVFEFIPELYENGMIKSAFHIGLDDLVDADNDFELNEYSREEVINYIDLLKGKYVEG
ncbi:MAG: hypothetical protein R2780_10850 [Crocinitomicaceae bacterium]|nr:hypothetical protein [Crocinitomicaceae bacterium]